MTTSTIEFNSQYLNDYLAMVEDSESPRIFHIWSALFAVASALGRRNYFPFGTSKIFPNVYVLLIGTPGTRKSTAANQAKKVLKRATNVKFAPGDTGFQRQGYILAFQGDDDAEVSKELAKRVDSVDLHTGFMGISELSNINLAEETRDPEDVNSSESRHKLDKHHMALLATEFTRVIGQGNLSMMDFLGERYDGEDYDYLTLKTSIKLKDTLLNMLSCTTPTSLATALPAQAGGQGFLSRVILVYGARKYKQVPFPVAPDQDLVRSVRETLSDANQLSGMFTLNPEAKALCNTLYSYQIETTDSRFAYYNERRFTHLLKITMLLAAADNTHEMGVDHVTEAHRILRATELGMPSALGEFGMNPQAQLKQDILEHLRSTMTPHTLNELIGLFHRDAKSKDIVEVINDLTRTGQIKVNSTKSSGQLISAVVTKKNTEDQMMRLLADFAS